MKVIEICTKKGGAQAFFKHDGKRWFFEIPFLGYREYMTFGAFLESLKRFKRSEDYGVKFYLV